MAAQECTRTATLRWLRFFTARPAPIPSTRPMRVPLLFRTWRGIHPQHPGLRASRVPPAVGRCALKIEAVARLEMELFSFQRQLQLAPQHVQEFFSFVGV